MSFCQHMTYLHGFTKFTNKGALKLARTLESLQKLNSEYIQIMSI